MRRFSCGVSGSGRPLLLEMSAFGAQRQSGQVEAAGPGSQSRHRVQTTQTDSVAVANGVF